MKKETVSMKNNQPNMSQVLRLGPYSKARHAGAMPSKRDQQRTRQATKREERNAWEAYR